MNITTVEKITELADGDTVLVISNQDIKQVPKEQVSDVKKITGLEAEIAELKKSGRDGRDDLAAAITEKGIKTAITDTMHEMAANVRKIPKGMTWKGVASDGIHGVPTSNIQHGMTYAGIYGVTIIHEEDTTNV